MQIKKIHRNIPQIIVALVSAFVTICVWGRGTGKTRGVTAQWLIERVIGMPRGTTALVTTTYAKMLSNVLPELVQGWEEMGYHLGFHYVLREMPHEDLNFERAFRPVVDATGAKHCIFWWNGHQTKLFSLDRKALSNGESVDAMAVEEARLCNHELLMETLRTVRGGVEHFGDKHVHGSILMVSDRPRQPHEKWLLDYEKQHTPKAINYIIGAQKRIMWLKKQVAKGHNVRKHEAEINMLNERVNAVRKKTVFFSEASTLDNIHVIGVDAIRQMKRTSTPLEYQIAVLNKNIIKVERGFYARIDSSKHGYEAYNYDYIDNLPVGSRPDCRWDMDVDPYAPLDISMDNNNAINCIATGQYCELSSTPEYRLLSTMYVVHPHLLREAVYKWHNYYQYHPTKEINFIFDNTANKSDATDDETFAQKVEKWLTDLGWKVNAIYVGQASSHHERYEDWSRTLQEGDADLPFVFRYNIHNCSSWEYAAMQTATKIRHTKKGAQIAKNKDSEKNPKIPPHEATHLTEAVDTLFMFRLSNPNGTGNAFVDSL